MNAPHARHPGAALLSPAALGSAALIIANDLWLKRQHPGLVSGKLSDLGLCIFLPLFLAAVIEWTLHVLGRRVAVNVSACILAASYFAAVKVFPAATRAHVEWLSLLVPRWHFRAVTDPTDLVCLPAIAVAWWTMKRSPSGSQSDDAPSLIPPCDGSGAPARRTRTAASRGARGGARPTGRGTASARGR